jgi:hypothetical protein
MGGREEGMLERRWRGAGGVVVAWVRTRPAEPGLPGRPAAPSSPSFPGGPARPLAASAARWPGQARGAGAGTTGVALGAVLARRPGRPSGAGGAAWAGGSRGLELLEQIVDVRVQPMHFILVLLVAGGHHALHANEVLVKLHRILRGKGRVNRWLSCEGKECPISKTIVWSRYPVRIPSRSRFKFVLFRQNALIIVLSHETHKTNCKC